MLALINAIKGAISGLSSWWVSNGNPDDTVFQQMDMGPSVSPRYWRYRTSGASVVVESANSLAGPWSNEGGFGAPNPNTAENVAYLIATAVAGLINSLTNGGANATTIANPDTPDGGASTTFTTSGGSTAGPDLPATPAAEWVEWLDAAGHRAATLVPSIALEAGGSTFITDALTACSNAVPLKIVGEQLLVVEVPAPVNAQWPTVDDWAVLLFQSATTSSVGQVHLPAPKAALFLADGETIDATSAAVAAVIAAAISADHGLRCPDGTRAGSYLGGHRQGRRGPAR